MPSTSLSPTPKPTCRTESILNAFIILCSNGSDSMTSVRLELAAVWEAPAMVKKVTVLVVLGLMLCITVIGYLLRVKSLRREISCAVGETGASVPATLECATTTDKKLVRSPRADNVHWGGAKKDGRIYDYPYRIRIPQRIAITQTQSNCLARSFTHIHAAKHVVSG